MMKLGHNEIIVLSLIKNYHVITEKSLQTLFLYSTGKKCRMDTILHSLQIKGLTDEKNKIRKEMVRQLDLPEIKIDVKIINNSKKTQVIKLGRISKQILFLLSITEKASLQFLSIFFKKPSQNIYAILQRLEEKECVVSYNSGIMRYSTHNRKYYPKYYTITDIGKLWVKINKNLIVNNDEIKGMLNAPEKEIKKYVL